MKLRTKKLRTKKLRTKKLKKTGGKIGDDSTKSKIDIQVILPISEINKMLIDVFELDYEMCGIYTLNSPIAAPFLLNEYSRIDGNSDNCTITNKEDYAIIWHTHSYKSKYYPSLEDLLTIFKIRRNRENIKVSIIYTTIGVWIIQTYETYKPNLIPQSVKDQIEETNNAFYRNTNRARDVLTPNLPFHISNYCDKLAKIGLFITFIDINNLHDVEILIENVRTDALGDFVV